jgi:hypothetical protein
MTPPNNPNVDNSSGFGVFGSTDSISTLTTAGTAAATAFNDITIASNSSSTGDFSIASTVTRNNIHRIIKVPLLLRVIADPAV